MDLLKLLFEIAFHYALYLAVFVALIVVLKGLRYIPNNRVGIVEKRFSRKGSIKSGFLALHGEAGYQPAVKRGGLHYLFPFQFKIHIVPLVTIPQGKIGYIFARDGKSLQPMQVLANNEHAQDFQDAAGFIQAGGQRGPQRMILREGTYAINLVQFVVITEEKVYALAMSREEESIIQGMRSVIAERGGFQPVIIKDNDDFIGIVTVHDGPSLPQGEIIAQIVGDDPQAEDTYHNKFQDADKYLRAGGMRGRQLQVLVEGTYYLNRLFATVEMIPKTIIEVGYVGVVVSYTGGAGSDLSGIDYKHGELVAKGCRGVWSEPLLPGKYPFNTYAGAIIPVPTTNIILKWMRNQTGSHRLDENLAEVSLITKDAFEPSLPLSVVVHIDYRKAPLVIQRFGDVKRLVDQTLDPMVSAYFKNIGQTRTLIQLIQDRSMIQKIASEEMKEKFQHYNLELEEVLIGTPASSEGDKEIENILTQLRSRQIAEEQIETYARQEKASVKERELREAEARARQQQHLTESELSITIQSNQGKADYQRSVQQASQIRALAEAESDRTRILGEGEAKKIQALAEAEAERAARVGIAQAMAIEEQVNAYGGPQFQLTQQVMQRFAEAIEKAGVDVVPKIIMSSGGSGNGHGAPTGHGNVLESLLAILLSEKMGLEVKGAPRPERPEAQKLKADLRKTMEKQA